jgi:hypothetical protein
MIDNNFYILKYCDEDPGCPTYLGGELSPEETEWELFEPHPDKVTVRNQYVLQITDTEIAFDMSNGDQPYVSQYFLEVCDLLAVPYRAIPLDILYPNGEKSLKDYFFFLPGANIQLMDRSASEFKEEKILGTDETQMNVIFTGCPMYAQIKKFVPLRMDTPHLFFCIENFGLVCTSQFRGAGTHKRLAGVRFVPLDENYRYNPWGED